MTVRRLPPQCLFCQHWRSPLGVGDGTGTTQTCTAFPAGIPTEIWNDRVDHRQPYEGDGGIQWESRDGAKFPEIAFQAQPSD